MTIFSASILAADFADLESQTRIAIEAGATWIHVDVMDGHFVPNITMGPLVVTALKPLSVETGAVMDVHLMITNPDAHIDAFAKAGADLISVHVETCPHLHRTLQHIRDLGVRPGVTLNPATPVSLLEPILPDVDLVMVMSVNPGFAGQKFIPASIDRVRQLRRMLDAIGSSALIEIDGGVGPGNAGEIAAAGCDVLVSGSSIFGGDIVANVRALKQAVAVTV